MYSVATDLSRGKITALTNVHLGPDLWLGAAPRAEGWRASLGQVGSAQGHLRGQNVAAGDVFLFFGWFRPAEHHQGTWRYVLGAPEIHSLFGWLQVGEVMVLNAKPETPAWLHDQRCSARGDERRSTRRPGGRIAMAAPERRGRHPHRVDPGASVHGTGNP